MPLTVSVTTIFDPNNHVAEVIAHGTVAEGEDKCATNKLEIVREIPWAEVLEIVNTGKACTGRCNSGDWNSVPRRITPGSGGLGLVPMIAISFSVCRTSMRRFSRKSPGLTLTRNKGVSAMKEYMIVKVQFNVSSKTCTGKLYTFLAYEEYTPGDVVVVDTQNGFQLATVEGTASKIPDGIPTGGLKEIVCKVDFTAWNERRERAKRMNELQCMMNNRVRDLQETALFEMLASKDPELKAMLDEYKTLRGC